MAERGCRGSGSLHPIFRYYRKRDGEVVGAGVAADVRVRNEHLGPVEVHGERVAFRDNPNRLIERPHGDSVDVSFHVLGSEDGFHLVLPHETGAVFRPALLVERAPLRDCLVVDPRERVGSTGSTFGSGYPSIVAFSSFFSCSSCFRRQINAGFLDMIFVMRSTLGAGANPTTLDPTHKPLYLHLAYGEYYLLESAC